MAEMTHEERLEEFSETARKTFQEHFVGAKQVTKGVLTVTLDKDVRLEAFNTVLHKGVYFIIDDEIDGSGGAANLYTIDVADAIASYDAEAARMEEDGLLENVKLGDGAVVTRPTAANDGVPIQFKINLVPVKVPGRDAPVTLLEASAWCAINEADDAGDHDRAHRLWRTGYGIPDHEEPECANPPKEAPALTQKDVTKLPSELSLPLDKVFGGLETCGYGEMHAFRVNGENENECLVRLLLSIDETFDGVATSKALTVHEKYFCGDVMSFWHAGIMQFTPATLWRFSTGQSRKPRPEEVAEVVAMVEKLRHTEATIDYSEELRKHSPLVKGGEYREFLLNLRALTARLDNGTEVTAYQFLSEPVLHRHNRETGKQISGCPRGLIEACAAKRSVTENSYNIRCYLLARVASMKRKGSKVSKRIKLETVMDKTGMDKTSGSEKRNARIIIAGYLDVFAEQKHIRGWKTVAGKRGVAEAYDIEV